MSSTGPTLNLTYDELLDEIKSILRVLSRHSSSSRDDSSTTAAFDRGVAAAPLRSGIHWHYQ
ncbi:hypothetical protein [Enterobacter hormaechei]|uniref:hypothetical protein n=1 Tax=Enterobacter hormaechei TaxID=158836 RepID=UPI002949B189|nr:hypothetical protein [Enterobacter hormaechei]MDV5353233.1 hypothetical protein [Enterobacter hormaechei]